jgi:hypothetical protein
LKYDASWNDMPPIKLAVPVVTVPVSNGFAEKVAANPDEVRVSVREPNGVTTIERPQGNPNHVAVRVDLVREVDADGRPIWEKAGAVHEYNPLNSLKA